MQKVQFKRLIVKEEELRGVLKGSVGELVSECRDLAQSATK